MYLKRITPPQEEPITLNEVKAHLRIDGDEENELLSALITTAREMAEEYTRRSLVQQEWELGIQELTTKVYLPRSPVREITYFAVDGQELGTDSYLLIGQEIFCTKKPLKAVMPDGIVIRYTAGFDADNIPEAIKRAILMLVGHLYENREGQPPENGYSLPPTVKVILRPYRAVML